MPKMIKHSQITFFLDRIALNLFFREFTINVLEQ